MLAEIKAKQEKEKEKEKGSQASSSRQAKNWNTFRGEVDKSKTWITKSKNQSFRLSLSCVDKKPIYGPMNLRDLEDSETSKFFTWIGAHYYVCIQIFTLLNFKRGAEEIHENAEKKCGK
jgi:hypothetical protein